MLAGLLLPRERVLSLSFLKASSYICVKTSYRDATDILNRFLRRGDGDRIKLRTLSDSIGRAGNEISGELSAVTARILAMYGFDDETGLPREGMALSDNITAPAFSGSPEIDGDKIRDAIGAVNAVRKEKILFSPPEISIESNPADCVYVSMDDIGVKHQKESRAESSKRDYKFVENTVAHIPYGDNTYILTGISMHNVFKSVLAFLLINNLLSHELVFLADGAKDIKSHIESVFQFHPYMVILDWFHLKKRCQKWLSMAIRGKEQRNAVLEKLLRILWVGDLSGATDYLSSLDASSLKNKKWRDELIGYFQKKGSSITCYALRAKLGLRNSSTPIEKVNDLIVAQRQKNNGMAWSPQGSGSLGALQMIYLNDQAESLVPQKGAVSIFCYRCP